MSTRLVTLAIVLVCVAASVWVATGRYARVETASGILLPIKGSARLYGSRPGTLTELLVKDGDYVTVGQKLAVIRVETPNGAGLIGTEEQLGSNKEQRALATHQVELSTRRYVSEAQRLGEIISGLRDQAITIEEQIRLQEQVVESATNHFTQIGGVVEKGYISRSEYERRRQAMLGAKQDLSRLHQQMNQNTAEIARITKEAARAKLDGESESGNARLQLESLKQQTSRIAGEASYTVQATVSGRVTALQTSVGSAVTNSVPLLAIIPDDSELRADLFVPSRAIGFVTAGQEVRLRYDAFPYQRFGTQIAHVETISRLAISGAETGAPFKIEEPVYRVTAILDQQLIQAYGRGNQLQAGMTLSASLILERQTFLDWMLDPLRAVTRRN